jgi:pimeloyl-ACP methyl ester carboxylesterase
MPFFAKDNARIYYEDRGRGEPVIAVHGLIGNTRYWKPLTDLIGERCRFISMDMRGHGYTEVNGEPHGYDVQTVGRDIVALADHLAIPRFHLLTHSTGGFAGVRHAMGDCSRFKSLILTNTASATSVVQGDERTIREYHDRFAAWFQRFDWDQIMGVLRVTPGPFFRGVVESPSSGEMLALAREMVRIGNRDLIAAFIRSFYTDPDPRVEGLRRISCPVLVVTGEKDDLMLEPSRLMAREIPGARILEYEGVGHMSALEAPDRLARDVMDFIAAHSG